MFVLFITAKRNTMPFLLSTCNSMVLIQLQQTADYHSKSNTTSSILLLFFFVVVGKPFNVSPYNALVVISALSITDMQTQFYNHQ